MPTVLAAAAMLLTSFTQSSALPFVDPLFSSDMVLQRDKADPIWGWTQPGTEVTVTIAGKTIKATADSSGKWMAKLPSFPAGGSFTLNVQGPSSAAFTNVTFGDVWICSGQSNMEFGVGNLLDPQKEISAANYPNIRLFAQPKLIAASPVKGVGDTWKVCTPENLEKDGGWGGFSAVGYFFGRKLNQDLNVPIGLIHSSWGGTVAEAWTSEPYLHKGFPEFDPQLKQLAAYRAQAGKGTEDQVFADWYSKNDAGSHPGQMWSDPAFDDSGWQTMELPKFFQQAGIPELVNNTSVVWFRKEISIDASAAGKESVLHFYADDNDVTFVNGVKVGATDGPQVARAYTLPAGTLHEGKNIIAIRVTDTGQPGGIYGEANSLSLTQGDAQVPLAGTWKLKLGTVINADHPFPVTLQDNPNVPTVLYNGMINPLAPFGIKGAIWYQGESNAGRGAQYQKLLPAMIGSWHELFGQGNFPFLIVQLAGFEHPPVNPGEDAWAEIREAQAMTAHNVPNGGLATAIDIGEQNDIHPKNKQEVGRRLALVAEAQVYGKHVEAAGPTYKSMKIEGGAIAISYDHAKGLKTSDGQPVKGFAIAGDDKKWVWADAKIEGNRVIVSSSQVPHPTAVRYAWAIFLDLNLQNGDGLPAFPFKTDSVAAH